MKYFRLIIAILYLSSLFRSSHITVDFHFRWRMLTKFFDYDPNIIIAGQHQQHQSSKLNGVQTATFQINCSYSLSIIIVSNFTYSR
ncbi:hypothetical protein CEXT_690921 [Caerostris extrusa]|uniref:Secreted protein n=1 Tax=Caerostris extrusa TaxID=172846 RepID=A0AAV4Y7X6_CAEEX|nr:hypothetical protein CEXT_690921 [Caerostris extrusa]